MKIYLYSREACSYSELVTPTYSPTINKTERCSTARRTFTLFDEMSSGTFTIISHTEFCYPIGCSSEGGANALQRIV